MSTSMVTPDAGPAVEMDVAQDLVRRGLPLAPILVGISAAGWGLSGALSSGYAIVLVMVNFLLAAGLMTWSARISLGFMMGTVLIGYALRLGL
ncbi:MAG: ATP synthase subunit I, partial [Actinomycetota bacterium]